MADQPHGRSDWTIEEKNAGGEELAAMGVESNYISSSNVTFVYSYQGQKKKQEEEKDLTV